MIVCVHTDSSDNIIIGTQVMHTPGIHSSKQCVCYMCGGSKLAACQSPL